MMSQTCTLNSVRVAGGRSPSSGAHPLQSGRPLHMSSVRTPSRAKFSTTRRVVCSASAGELRLQPNAHTLKTPVRSACFPCFWDVLALGRLWVPQIPTLCV
eukprot:4814774-Pyramimonas_sp.AAC.1